jgi:hypothetical protein
LKALSIVSEGQGSEQLQGTPRDHLDTQFMKDSSAAPDQGRIFSSGAPFCQQHSSSSSAIMLTMPCIVSVGDGQIDLQQLVASLNRIKTHNMQVSVSCDALAAKQQLI